MGQQKNCAVQKHKACLMLGNNDITKLVNQTFSLKRCCSMASCNAWFSTANVATSGLCWPPPTDPDVDDTRCRDESGRTSSRVRTLLPPLHTTTLLTYITSSTIQPCHEHWQPVIGNDFPLLENYFKQLFTDTANTDSHKKGTGTKFSVFWQP